jgi:membrane protein DedA with SNARE-associated domain
MSLSLPIAALILAALVIADFFIPMLPSATMIAALAGYLAGDPLLIAALIAWAASASWLGDLLGYHALRHTRARMRTPIPASANATRLEIKLRATLRHRPYSTTIIARFLPAGRTALTWAAVTTTDYPRARMSAIAAAAWAAITVGLGLLIGSIFGAGLWSAATTATAACALSAALTWWFKTARTHGRA